MTNPDDSHSAQLGDEQDAPHGGQPGDAKSVSDLTADQLLEMITGEGTTDADDVEDGNDLPDDPAPEVQAADAKPPGRLSVRALPPEQQIEMARAIELVREGKAADVFEAIASMRSPGAPKAAAAEPDAAAPEVPPSSPPAAPEVSAIETELADLRAQRKAAKAEFDTDAEEDLTTRIEDTLMRLQEAKLEAQRATQANTAWQAKYLEAVDELESQYPDTLDDGSEFSTLLDDLLTAARARKDPGLQDPRHILVLAERVAGLLTPPPSGRRPSAPPPVPRPTGRALAPAHSSVNRPTVDQVEAMIRDADPDDLLAALVAD